MIGPEHDTRRFTSAERRRRTILEAAIRIIGEGGPDAITHRAVAARAQVPLGSITYYFENRDRLIVEAFRHLMAETRLWLAALAGEGKSPRRKLNLQDVIDVASLVLQREFTEPANVRAEYELMLYITHAPSLRREFLAYQRSIEAGFAQALELLGTPRPTEASRTIIGLVRSFELERFVDPEASLEDFRRRLTPVVEALVGSQGVAGSNSTGFTTLQDRAARKRAHSGV